MNINSPETVIKLKGKLVIHRHFKSRFRLVEGLVVSQLKSYIEEDSIQYEYFGATDSEADILDWVNDSLSFFVHPRISVRASCINGAEKIGDEFVVSVTIYQKYDDNTIGRFRATLITQKTELKRLQNSFSLVSSEG